jgi:hypothetical protein
LRGACGPLMSSLSKCNKTTPAYVRYNVTN